MLSSINKFIVPCMVRVRSLEEGYKTQQSQTLKDDDGEDWVAPVGSSCKYSHSHAYPQTPHNSNKTASGNSVGEIPDVAKLNITSPPPASNTTTTTTTTTPASGDDDEDDEGTGEIPDMDNFEVDDNLVEDDKVLDCELHLLREFTRFS